MQTFYKLISEIRHYYKETLYRVNLFSLDSKLNISMFRIHVT